MVDTKLPYAFIDVDGVLHGSHMKYGYEQTSVVVERVPRELVHPLLIPMEPYAKLPDYLQRRRPPKPLVTFRTRVRTSPRLREDLASLPVQPLMLTTWLEHNSVDQFFAQTPGPDFPGRQNLTFPGRDSDGSLPWSWKYDLLKEAMARDPRPFIWLDDDEVPKFRDRVLSDFGDIPSLLIAPAYDIGLTRSHVALIRSFLADLESE